MKIRTGFVSNSSSSSFVIILEQENYDKVYNKITALQRELLDYITPKKVKRFGKNLVIVSGMTGNDSVYEDFSPETHLTEEEEDELENNGPDCMFEDIEKELCKHPHIYHTEDF